VLDGEIVIDGDGDAQAFGALQPAGFIRPRSRIEAWRPSGPASYVAFDLLERDGAELLGEPFGAPAARRSRRSTGAAVRARA